MKAAPLLLAGLAAIGARAGDFSLDTTVDLLYRRNLLATEPGPDRDPAPGQYQYALSMVGHQGAWTGGATLRDVDFFQQVPNRTLAEAQVRLYRKYLKYDAEPWTIQAGDFNTLLGRGLLLSVIQNPAILQDRTIVGLELRWRGGQLELHGLTGVAGTEPRDQLWRVAGGEATVEYLPGNRVGLRACTIQDGRVPRFGQRLGLRQCRSASLSGDKLFGTLSYYGEWARIDYRDQQPPPFYLALDPRRGRGVYENLTWHRKAWLLMAEHKEYLNFNDELNTPPLADRDTEKNTLDDGSGQRLYAQYSFREPDLTLFASGGRYREGRQWGHNVYGGFKLQDGFDRLDATCTYGLRTVAFLEKRTDAALTWRFTPLWSLDLTWHDKRNRPPGGTPYEESDLTIQLARSPRFSVYGLQQRSSLPVFSAIRMYSGGFRVNLRKDSYLDCSAGRLRGGEVCAGGQCITLPPFKGWKVAAHLRF